MGWLSGNWIAIFLFALCLFLVWRYARPFVQRAVVGVLAAQERAMPTGSPQDELDKRAETLVDVINRLIRFLLLLAVVFVVFGVFDLWPMVAGLGLVIAALTVAGQSVILDYIMGILILVEGQYFKGDTILGRRYRGPGGGGRPPPDGAQGPERDRALGVQRHHPGVLQPHPHLRGRGGRHRGVRNADVEAVIAVMDQVGREMAEDPAWAASSWSAPRIARRRHSRTWA